MDASARRPYLIVGTIVLAFVVVWLLAKRNASAGSGTVVTFANTPQGDTTAQNNAAAISEAAIAAGSQGVQQAAALIGLENTNATQQADTAAAIAGQTNQAALETGASVAETQLQTDAATAQADVQAVATTEQAQLAAETAVQQTSLTTNAAVQETGLTTAATTQQASIAAQLAAEEARITADTQRAITDSNNALAARVAANNESVAQAQVAQQRQATTDSTISNIAGDVGKVLQVLSLGFL